MSLPVAFFRTHLEEMELRGKSGLFEVEARFQGEVDPESGMVLNLVRVDELLREAVRSTRSRDPKDEADLVSFSQQFLQREASLEGARLQSVSWREMPDGVARVWDSRHPTDLICRPTRALRIRIGDRLRVGTLTLDFTAVDWEDAGGEPAGPLETSVAKEDEIMEKLDSLFPQALQITFRDLKTGESWSRRL